MVNENLNMEFPMYRRNATRFSAFTLVELLVVIGIIALLISILLPSLQKARNAANTVACLANLRSIGQAMQIYVSENRGSIPGAGMTSGRGLVTAPPTGAWSSTYTMTTLPEGSPISLFDYIAPLTKVMGLKLQTSANASGYARFNEYRTLKQFTCPANGSFVTSPYGANGSAVGSMLSYNTGAAFLLTAYVAPAASGQNFGINGATQANATGSQYWTLPSGYGPKITKVGGGAAKIYMADGGKYSNSYDADNVTMSFTSPTDNHQFNGFSDYGAFFGNTKSWDRAKAFNAAYAIREGRLFAFRHGSEKAGAAAGSFRFNAVFYDGHAETLDDMTGSNPHLWLPRGTVLPNPPTASVSGPRTTVFPDTATRFNIVAGTVIQ